jgi:flagellar L-ring protein precursor FlgH
MRYLDMQKLLLSFFAAGLAFSACGPAHIKEYEPKERDYELPVDIQDDKAREKKGSLWSNNDESNYMYADQRAIKKGDILTVKVEEFANAQRSADTSVERTAELNANIEAFLGAIGTLEDQTGEDIAGNLADAQTDSSFESQGSTGRQQRLTATVPAVIRKRLPSGDFFIEGHRVILVNHEEHHFYVSGVARRNDIDESNTIPSSKLADAQVEFTGRGVLSEQNEPGFLFRTFGWIWPF